MGRSANVETDRYARGGSPEEGQPTRRASKAADHWRERSERTARVQAARRSRGKESVLISIKWSE